MPTKTAFQDRWEDVTRDSLLQGLPYKIETNAHGQLVLSPHTNRHSDVQEQILLLLHEHAPAGHQPPEYAVTTSAGVKTPDNVWMSSERRDRMRATGDPTTLAPEICIEVVSDSNTPEEMAEKRALYVDAGAEEVWMVDVDTGRVRFYDASGPIERSHLAPAFPVQVDV